MAVATLLYYFGSILPGGLHIPSCMVNSLHNSFLVLQDIAIRSESVLYVYPVETAKTSVYYAMQFLKVHLPNVVIKVS